MEAGTYNVPKVEKGREKSRHTSDGYKKFVRRIENRHPRVA